MHKQLISRLVEEQDFSDVTFVSDDGEKVQAQIVVLSSCSPVLKKMLLGSPQHQQTLIYLAGIQHSEINSLLNFMYIGETKVHQEELDRFIQIGTRLKIKGLANTNDDRNEQQMTTSSTNVLQLGGVLESPVQSLVKGENFDTFDSSVVDANYSATQFQNFEKILSCEKCDYKAKQVQKLRIHVDAKHKNVKYTCDQCLYSSGYPHHLYTHKKTKHTSQNK